MFDDAWFQGSLLDAAAEESVGALGLAVERHHLTRGAWVDLRRGWVAGSDDLFARLMDRVPWHAELWKKYSVPSSARINPNPFSLTSRLILPFIAIAVLREAEHRTSRAARESD